MFCPNCGTKVSETEIYCHQCGKKIKSTKITRKQRNRFPKGIIIVLVILSIILIGLLFIKSLNNNVDNNNQVYIRDEELLEDNDTGAFILDTANMNLHAGDVEETLESLSLVGAIIGVSDPKNELTIKNETAFDNETYYRFEQSYKGIPVIGKSIIVESGESGEIECITYNATEIADFDTEPELSEWEAVIKLEEQTGYKADESELELCIFLGDSNNPGLAYRIESGFYSILIDANNGSILQLYEKVSTVKESVRLQGQSTERNVEIEKQGKQYLFYDSTRNIYVYDSRNVSKNMSQDDVCALSPLIVFDEGATGPSSSAVDALYNIQQSYDFWNTELGRKSTDGKGKAKIEIYDFFAGYISAKNEQKDYTDNAAAGSDPADVLTRVFIGPRSQTGISTYSDDVEVMAHEYTHAVLSFIVDLSNDEGGAINEGLADIMGELTHASYNNGNCDWKNSVRNMEDPANSPNNKKCISNYKQYDKSIDEHYSSTILSHTAYLMWSAPNAPSGIKPITDYKKMSKLWYQTMLLLKDHPSFKDIRAACEMSAYKMMKKEILDQPEFNCVVWAFDQSGIGYDNNFFEDDTVDTDDLQIIVKDYAGNKTTDYMLFIESGDGTKVYSGDGKDVAKQKINLPEGIYSFYISSPYKGFPDYRKVRKVKNMRSALGVKSTSRGNNLFGNQIVFNSIYGTGIYGTVNDDSGKKLNKVSIFAKRAESVKTNGDTEYWEAVSNENGEYYLFMPEGSYVIEGMLEGYQNVEVTADVFKSFSEMPIVIPVKEFGDSRSVNPDYSQVIEELESEYGELRIVPYEGGDEAIGLCYLNLIDFTKDGKDELMAVCKYENEEHYTGFIYTIRNGKAELMYENSQIEYENGQPYGEILLSYTEDTGYVFGTGWEAASGDAEDKTFYWYDGEGFSQVYRSKGRWDNSQQKAVMQESLKIIDLYDDQHRDQFWENMSEVWLRHTSDRSYLESTLRDIILKVKSRLGGRSAEEYTQKENNEKNSSDSYRGIIEQYQEVLTNHYNDYELESLQSKYPLLNYNLINDAYINEYGLSYWLYDIDKNGTEELFIAVASDYGKEETSDYFYALYTQGADQIIPLITDCVYRTVCYVCEDGSIIKHGSGGALYGGAWVYKMNDKKDKLVLNDEYEIDYENYPDTPYSNERERLTKEEFDSKYRMVDSSVFVLEELN